MENESVAPTSLDVAAAIIESASDVDQLKLQKLLYYAQAWYLAWYDEPMFNDTVEGWRHGPAVPTVFRVYGGEGGQGRSIIRQPSAGNAEELDEKRQTALAAVIEAYDRWTGPELAELSKGDPLWRESRRGLSDDENGHQVIPRKRMGDFYRQSGKFGEGGNGDELARSLGLVVAN